MRVASHVSAVLSMFFAISACSKGKESAEDKSAGTSQVGSAATQDRAPDTVQSRPARTKVTLQLNWVPEPEFGGFYAAAHRGIYEKEGLDVDIVAGSAGVQTWKMVATDKVPFAIAEAGEILQARLKDANVVGLFAVYQTSPRALMVHEASGVRSLEEIFTSGEIKKVAMEAGLPFVRFLEKKYGFGKVQVVQYGGNLSLFLQDPKMAQQCFAFAEPVSARQQGVAVKTFSVAESGHNPYMAVLITSDSYLQANREVVDRFVRATRQGWQAYLDDPEPTNEYMKIQGATMELDAMKIAAELQTPYVVSDETKAHYLGYMSKERWQALAEQLKELGELDGIPDVSRAFVDIPAQ